MMYTYDEVTEVSGRSSLTNLSGQISVWTGYLRTVDQHIVSAGPDQDTYRMVADRANIAMAIHTAQNVYAARCAELDQLRSSVNHARDSYDTAVAAWNRAYAWYGAVQTEYRAMLVRDAVQRLQEASAHLEACEYALDTALDIAYPRTRYAPEG
jgi:hypothetical protein